MKKAFLAESGIVIFSSLALIVIFIIFMVLFSLLDGNAEFSIKSTGNDIDSDIVLNNLLITPVTVDDEIVPMYDLITFWHYENKYQPQLGEELQKTLTHMEHYYKEVYEDKNQFSCRKHYRIEIIDAKFNTVLFAVTSYNYYKSADELTPNSDTFCFSRGNTGSSVREITLPDKTLLQLKLYYQILKT